MLSLDTLLAFIPVITILVILPGPDFAIVSKISLIDGPKQGQAAAFGVALGICLHTVLAMLGISAILAQSAVLYTILKYAGALYLFYLGIKAIIQSFGKNPGQPAKVGLARQPKAAPQSFWQPFNAAFLTNALNPKAILYFLVLYPQFLNASAPVFSQFMEMGLITAFICIVWYVSLAWLLGKIRALFASQKFQRWLLRVMGGIFIAFGLKLAVDEME